MSLTHATVPLLHKTHHLFAIWLVGWLIGSFKNAQFSILLYVITTSESQNYLMLASISSVHGSNTTHYVTRLGLDIGLVTADVLLELEELSGKLDLLLKEVLSIELILGGIAGVLLNVKADSSSRRASTRESDDDTAAGGEAGVQTLLGGDGAV